MTALKEDVDRIIGLEVGADDYLGKPFNPRELAARIRAVLRRSGDAPPADATVERTFRFEGFKLGSGQRRVLGQDGAEVALTSAEFDLLLAFLERPGRMLSRDQLLDITQGRSVGPVNVLVGRVRRKLGDAGNFRILKTQRNGGYQFIARVMMEETHR